MNSNFTLWALPASGLSTTSLAPGMSMTEIGIAGMLSERHERMQAFIQDPESVDKFLYDWFPGRIKGEEGPVAKMSCKAPLFLEDYQRMQKNLNSLENNDKVEMLLLEVNSPGGQVCGCKETYEAFRDFKKPSAAVVCGQATSAAYWLSAGCGMIVATESSSIGSIGVIASITSVGKMLEAQGINVYESAKGPKKNQFSFTKKEFDESAKKDLDEGVREAYQGFVDCVKESRENVDKKVFDSGVFTGQSAVDVGLLDRVENKIGAL